MRAFMRSLIAEFFPRWVKKDAIQHRPGIDPKRRMAELRQPPPEKKTSFGQRSTYRTGPAQRKGRGASGAGTRPS